MNLKIAPQIDEENDLLLQIHDLRLPYDRSLLSCAVPQGLTLLYGESSMKRHAVVEALRSGRMNVWIYGKPINISTEEQKILLRLSVVDKDAPLVEHFTVIENILLPFRTLGIKDQQMMKDVKQGLEWFKLDRLRNKVVQYLTPDEKFTVALCRAVLTKNRYLIVHPEAALLEEVLTYARPLARLGVSVVVLTEILPDNHEQYRVIPLC